MENRDLPLALGSNLFEFLHLEAHQFYGHSERRKVIFNCRLLIRSALERKLISSLIPFQEAFAGDHRLTELLKSMFPMYLTQISEIPSIESIRNYVDLQEVAGSQENDVGTNESAIEKLIHELQSGISSEPIFSILFAEALVQLCKISDSVIESRFLMLKDAIESAKISSEWLLQPVLDASETLSDNEMENLCEMFMMLTVPSGFFVKILELIHQHKTIADQAWAIQISKFLLLILEKASATLGTVLDDLLVENLELFYTLIPTVYKYFETRITGDFECLKLLLKRIDPQSVFESN